MCPYLLFQDHHHHHHNPNQNRNVNNLAVESARVQEAMHHQECAAPFVHKEADTTKLFPTDV